MTAILAAVLLLFAVQGFFMVRLDYAFRAERRDYEQRLADAGQAIAEYRYAIEFDAGSFARRVSLESAHVFSEKAGLL